MFETVPNNPGSIPGTLINRWNDYELKGKEKRSEWLKEDNATFFFYIALEI